jgi:crotonobetainyl-CoA:carnitine CoA-transferase CaiB-like acyl-CoA transferase
MSQALGGLVVIDLGQVYNGPYCSMLLAQLGADVIKVEPFGGEPLRWRETGGRETQAFVLLNAGKRSIRLNLRSERGRELLLSLARGADVLIENFAPGAMDRLGLGFEVLLAENPRLVIASGKGYGSTGPYRGLRAMDLTVQAMSGVLASTGFPGGPPVKSGAALADFSGGTHLLAGVLAALYQRTATGQGQVVEVSMHDAVIPTLTSPLAAYLDSGGTVPERTGNRHGGLAVCPYNVYETADGWIAIMCTSDRHWRSLADLMGQPELASDPRLESNPKRAQHIDELDGIVGAWCAARVTGQLVEVLTDAGIPMAPVVSVRDLVEDPQVRARGMLRTVEQPGRGPMLTLGAPIRLGDSAPAEPSHAPLLGEHSREILSERIGLTSEQIDELYEQGVI